MNYTRTLKQGMTGSDVKYIKELLFELGYYSDSIKKITHTVFGKDTTTAVRNFQSKNLDSDGKKLVVDGLVGKKTWSSLVKASEVKKEETNRKKHKLVAKNYPNISAKALKSIEASLASTTDARYDIVSEILHYAYDQEVGGGIQALYMWGGNLYNTDLKLNIATVDKIEKEAKDKPSYYNGNRKEMMIAAVKKNKKLAAADCSGMIVGYLRKRKYVKNKFDTTANSLCSDSYSTKTTKNKLAPGDWVGYKGHVGTYVGGNYVVEFAGGSYGCQLTKLDDRKLYSFVSKRVIKSTPWDKFRVPKYY